MSTLFSLPVPVALDTDGSPLMGASLTFTESGTSTPKAIYADADLTTPLANPLTSDAFGQFTPVWLDAALYRVSLADAHGVTRWTVDEVGGPVEEPTAAEIAAGVTPTNYAYPPVDVRRYGTTGDGVTDDTAAINTAISVAVAAGGGYVDFPVGTFLISSTITLPNRVTLRGENGRATVILAAGSFTGSWMFHAINGTSSMFNSRLEDLHLNCSSVAGLGGIWSQAWQENCGLRRCIVQNFRTSGIKFDDTYYGGAATCKIEDTEFFGSTSGASYGIDMQSVSLVGSFVVTLDHVTVSGGTAALLTAGVNVVTDSLVAIGVHVENCSNGFLLDGPGSHTLINCTGSGTGPVVDLVEVAATYTGALSMIGCKRASATNFINNIVSGSVITGAVADPAQYVHPNVANSTVPLFTDGDTTPSVSGGDVFRTLNTAPTTITNLDNGSPGQIVTILFGDSQTTLSGANFSLRGSFTSLVTGTMQLIYSAAVWYEVARTASTTTHTYAPTNVSTDRAYNANSTTLDEVADVLGTLIADLQARGLIQ